MMRLTEFSNVPRRSRSARVPRILLAAAVACVAASAPVYAAGGDEGFAIRSGGAVLRSASPRQAGKVPVVLIHGMLGTPGLWAAMIERLSADPSIGGQFQLLTFGYDSLQPIPDSARELLGALSEARRLYDPEGRDASFERIVLVGHSLGGLIAKAAANGDAKALSNLTYAARDERSPASPRAGRLIFIATPHRGTPIDQGLTRSAGSRLARAFSPSSAARPRRGGHGSDAVTSIDELTPDHPLLVGLERARAAAGVPFHSIIAALGDPAAAGATDGLVPVASARLSGARSEVVVRGTHLCHHDPDVIREVGRVLGEHSDEAARLARVQARGPATAAFSRDRSLLPGRPENRLMNLQRRAPEREIRFEASLPFDLGPFPTTEDPDAGSGTQRTRRH